jgi:ABC-type hemin transport system ATPase subunit
MYKISSDVYNGFEARTIDVLLDCNKLRFDLVYRQPDSSHYAAHSFHTLKLAKNSVINDKGTVFVLGDFNQGIFYSAVIHKMCSDKLKMCSTKSQSVQ